MLVGTVRRFHLIFTLINAEISSGVGFFPPSIELRREKNPTGAASPAVSHPAKSQRCFLFVETGFSLLFPLFTQKKKNPKEYYLGEDASWGRGGGVCDRN